jgi:hypothetical protein
MADDKAVNGSRPSSPIAEVKQSRRERERRRSGSKSPAAADISEFRRLNPIRQRPTRGGTWEEAIPGHAPQTDSQPGQSGSPEPKTQHGQKLLLPRRPRLLGHTEGEDDISARNDLDVMLYDISQSSWIEDSSHSVETVYLTVEGAKLPEMVTIDISSLCWMYVLKTYLQASR